MELRSGKRLRLTEKKLEDPLPVRELRLPLARIDAKAPATPPNSPAAPPPCNRRSRSRVRRNRMPVTPADEMNADADKELRKLIKKRDNLLTSIQQQINQNLRSRIHEQLLHKKSR